jgi:hypothetical protein
MTPTQAINYWVDIYTYILLNQVTAGGDWIFVDYDEILAGTGLNYISSILGASANASFVDQSLRRAPADEELPKRTRDLYQELLERSAAKY